MHRAQRTGYIQSKALTDNGIQQAGKQMIRHLDGSAACPLQSLEQAIRMRRHLWRKAAQQLWLKRRREESPLCSPCGTMADQQAVANERRELLECGRLAQCGIVQRLARLLGAVQKDPQLGAHPEAVGGAKAFAQLCKHQKDVCDNRSCRDSDGNCQLLTTHTLASACQSFGHCPSRAGPTVRAGCCPAAAAVSCATATGTVPGRAATTKAPSVRNKH